MAFHCLKDPHRDHEALVSMSLNISHKPLESFSVPAACTCTSSDVHVAIESNKIKHMQRSEHRMVVNKHEHITHVPSMHLHASFDLLTMLLCPHSLLQNIMSMLLAAQSSRCKTRQRWLLHMTHRNT